jgi:hypothetical protein
MVATAAWVSKDRMKSPRRLVRRRYRHISIGKGSSDIEAHLSLSTLDILNLPSPLSASFAVLLTLDREISRVDITQGSLVEREHSGCDSPNLALAQHLSGLGRLRWFLRLSGRDVVDSRLLDAIDAIGHFHRWGRMRRISVCWWLGDRFRRRRSFPCQFWLGLFGRRGFVVGRSQDASEGHGVARPIRLLENTVSNFCDSRGSIGQRTSLDCGLESDCW